MKPFLTLGESITQDGSRLTLQTHDGDTFLKLNGRQLMSSRSTISEIALAEVGCAVPFPQHNLRILIGGLGLGFTLGRVLELVCPKASVHVVEVIPDVVAWNRELLGERSKARLEDPRVTIMIGDIFQVIQQSTGSENRYDCILLDVDNGPVAMVSEGNRRLYNQKGIRSISRALKPGGRVGVWSAEDDPAFLYRLNQAGFQVEVLQVKAHDRAKRAAHRIYLAVTPGSIEQRQGLPPNAT